MLPVRYIMDTSHRHPGSGQWINSYGHHRDYRHHVEIYGPESDQGDYRPLDHNLYSGAHPRGYEWSQQWDIPNGNHQGYRTMQNSAAHWHYVSGSYSQRAPNVTVHCTGQKSATHSLHQPCCSSHSFTQEGRGATVNSQQFTGNWHCFSNDRFTEHSQGHSRRQSRRHFKGQRLSVKGCSSRGTKTRNASSVLSLVSSSQEVHPAQKESTSGMVAAPLQEHRSDSPSALQGVDKVLRDMVPQVNKSNTADHPRSQELSSGAVSGCTASQQIGSSSQSYATDRHGTSGHCTSASTFTRDNSCSLPVNAVTNSTSIEPLDLSPVEETLPGKQIVPITIKAITKWLEKRIDMIVPPKDIHDFKTQNAKNAFAVEKMEVLQPGRCSKGSREEDSTPLCVEVQSTSRCMVVKAVPIVPPPVAVVPPLEPQASSEPTESRVQVHSSEQVSVADKLGWKSESAVKRLLSRVKRTSENGDSSNAEGHLIAREQVHAEENDTSRKTVNTCSYSSRISHGKEVIKHPVETKERVLEISSLPVSQYTLSELRKLIAELESLIIPENSKDNLIDTLLNCFWGGDMQNLLRFGIREFVKEIVDTFPFVARDENAVVLRAVDGVHVEELIDKCVSFSPKEFKSSWLNINDSVDDMDAELGVASSQYLIPQREGLKTKCKKHEEQTKMGEDTVTMGVETEKETQTKIATELGREALIDFMPGVGKKTKTKTATGIDVYAEKEVETEAVPQGNRQSATERVDLLPASPTALDKDPYFNPVCAVKITYLKTMEAKKLFDLLQENASGQIDLETLFTEGEDVETSEPGEDQIMNHGDPNTPDPLSVAEEPDPLLVTEEPARLGTGTELSSRYSHLIETSDGSGLVLHSKCLTEGSSELLGGGHQIIPVVECFSLSDLVTISDQEDSEEEAITDSKLQTMPQDLNTDWTEPLSSDEQVTDPEDELDATASSELSVCIDREETEEVQMEPNDEPEHQTSHEELSQPSSPCHLTTSVTSDPEANMIKPWSEEEDPQCVNGQCSTTSPPLEEFDSIDAFLIAKLGVSPDSRHDVSVRCRGNAESHCSHRLKRPKTSCNRRLSESNAEDGDCMDSAVCVPKSRLPVLTLTDRSSHRPKIRIHLTKCNSEHNPNRNKISMSSEAVDCEHEDTMPNVLPVSYISESNSVIHLMDKVSAIQVSVTRRTRSNPSHTARLSSNKTCKWNQSTTTDSEDSSNDSTVSQYSLVECRGKHSCTSPLPCSGVQCLTVCGSLTSTAPLQLRRTSSSQKMTSIEKTTERSTPMEANQVISMKHVPHNPTFLKERPHSDQTSHVKMQSHTKSLIGKIVKKETRNEHTSPDPNSTLKTDREESKEKRKKERNDESNLNRLKLRSKSPFWKTGKQSEERGYTKKSSRHNSPMQRKERRKEEGEKGKTVDHSLQINGPIPVSQSTGVKVKWHREKRGRFDKTDTKKEMKERREDKTVVQKSSHPDSPARKKERKEERDKCEDTNGDKKAPAPHKVQHKTETNLQSTSLGPKVRISSIQVHPSTAKAASPPSKEPERSIGSVRKQVLSDWQTSYYPTPAQKRKRSGPNEEDQASPEKKSISPSHERKGGSVKKEQQSASRRVGRPEISPYVKQRRESQEHATPLMKRSMVQAKLWTSAISHKTLKDIRCNNSHGTQKPKGQSRSFGEGYKWTEKRNKVKNCFLKYRR